MLDSLKLAGLPSSVDIVPNLHPIPAPSRLVAVLAYDGLCTFEFGIAYEVFGLPRPEFGPHWYRFIVAAAEPGPLRAAGGLTVSADRGIDALSEADLIVVPGWRDIEAQVPVALTDALRDAHRRGARIMSLCSGIAVLAAAGLLSGRRATTHWRYMASVRDRYPDVALEPNVLYVDEGSLLTAAGSAAGIDLCLHVVRRDFGPAVANSVARRLVVPPHRDGGQAQYVESPVVRERESARFGPLIDWLRQNLHAPLTVSRMANRAGMSSRTFQRRFASMTGVSPGEWVLLERLRHARDLIEQAPRGSLDDIAAATGFGSLAAMRHHFRARLGTSPQAYRRHFAHEPDPKRP